MPPVVIDNPILNSPFAEPARHFRFDEDGITSEIAEGRRRSTYFIPIPNSDQSPPSTLLKIGNAPGTGTVEPSGSVLSQPAIQSKASLLMFVFWQTQDRPRPHRDCHGQSGRVRFP